MASLPVNIPCVYLVAGEASGDFLGASLMKSLKILNPHVRFSGVGGPLMIQEGLESLFPMEELSLMGIVEILPHLPRLLRRLRQTKHHILSLNPEVVVTIDSPGFNFALAKK